MRCEREGVGELVAVDEEGGGEREVRVEGAGFIGGSYGGGKVDGEGGVEAGGGREGGCVGLRGGEGVVL